MISEFNKHPETCKIIYNENNASYRNLQNNSFFQQSQHASAYTSFSELKNPTLGIRMPLTLIVADRWAVGIGHGVTVTHLRVLGGGGHLHVAVLRPAQFLKLAVERRTDVHHRLHLTRNTRTRASYRTDRPRNTLWLDGQQGNVLGGGAIHWCIDISRYPWYVSRY